MNHRPHPGPARWQAFSLVELLVVIAVMVILLALLAPAFQNVGRALSLTTASQSLAGSLMEARGAALTRNRSVEIRFYNLPPKEGVGPPATRAFRAFVLDEEGTSSQPLNRIRYLPTGIVLAEEEEFSSLLSPATLSQDTEDLPGQAAATYHSFRFKPDGSTNLDPSRAGGWFVTLRPESAELKANGLPANFVTIQIDPVTGLLRQFRP